MSHAPRICRGRKPTDGNAWFSSDGRVFWAGRSTAHCGYWQVNLRCPRCGREARFVENRVKNHSVLCDGERFIMPHQQTLDQAVVAEVLETRVRL